MAAFSASSTGVLVYAGGLVRPNTKLTWMDRNGRTLGTIGELAIYTSIALSPDERRVATAMAEENRDRRDIWIVNVPTGTPTRFTFEPGNTPVWSADGTRVAFSANRGGRAGITGQTSRREHGRGGHAVVGTRRRVRIESNRLVRGRPLPDFHARPRRGRIDRHLGAAARGRSQAVRRRADPRSRNQRRALAERPLASVSGRRRQLAAANLRPAVSADRPDLPGIEEQRPTAGVATRRQGIVLSTDGHVMSAAVDTGDRFAAAAPARLFTPSSMLPPQTVGRHYAVTRDGRFLVNLVQGQTTTVPLTVVVNWLASVQK